MKKKNQLIQKVKHLLRKIKAPTYLHRFGPKIYKLWQHIFALFFKANCKLSYRRTSFILRQLGFKVATKSTLQRYSQKLKLPFWRKLFQLTTNSISKLMAIDGTGLSKTNVSEHYIKRINGDDREGKAYHFSVMSDIFGKIVSLKLRKRYRHDSKDVKVLLRNSYVKPKVILMDRGYDAEWIHEFFEFKGIHSIAPVRVNAKRGFYRKKLKKNFPKKLYNKRSIIESVFHAFKQKYGSSVSSKKIASARSEVYCKAILYNLFFILGYVLGHTLKI